MTALDVACPYCGANPGEHCRTAMRTIDREGNPHYVRVQEANRKGRADPAQVRLL